MPHVSKRKLTAQTEKQLIHSMQTVLTKIEKTEEMESFLYALLSKTEQVMFAKRLAVIVLLEEGIAESTIADTLRVTRETVARIKTASELRGDGFRIALEKLKQEKTHQDFKKFLLSLAKYTIRAAGGRVKPNILD